ncbi:MAG: DNA cytosine methyltransferase [Planctomycetales bacterium]|nr:DNA cytosine methyltransferase [Planctomycetales bacterium]MCC0059564.1 DNA cytosine methyltransferase [Hyphomicrobiaceae bacterium]
MTRPIAVDLFAGAGGLSLGFEQAGFDVVGAVESDPIHCAVHKFNFPTCAILPEPIGSRSTAKLRQLSRIGNRSVDCVFGGPPCQGFSLIGHRALNDPRNSLVLEFVRTVVELDAKSFVFENVKGLTVGYHRALLEELVTAFDAAGYAVRLPWKVLDASSYGVPQRRQRLFLIGTKKGLPLPEYPPIQTAPADDSRDGVCTGPTCEEALADLPNADRYAELESSDSVRIPTWGRMSSYAQELRCIADHAWHYGYKRRWDPGKLTSSWRTRHTEISQRRFSETAAGKVEPISRFFRLDRKGLSNTLRAGTDGARGAFTSPRPVHYEFPRCITVREMARLHSFPDWFRLHSTKWHGARQVGNAVPPAMARAVAAEVMKALGQTPQRPSEGLELGDESLLYFDMSKAAQFFDVPAPNTRRDRKSGAKKRKQHDIERARLVALTANG